MVFHHKNQAGTNASSETDTVDEASPKSNQSESNESEFKIYNFEFELIELMWLLISLN